MFTTNGKDEKQHLERLKKDPRYAKQWERKHSYRKEIENPLSNGRHANATNINKADNSDSDPDSFFNSYWFVVVMVVGSIIIMLLMDVLG